MSSPALLYVLLLAAPAAVQDTTAAPVQREVSAERGSVTRRGLYLAPATPGRDVVVTRNGALADTSLVDVTAPARRSPAPAGLWLDEDFSRYTSMDHLLSNPFGWLTNPREWPRWYHTREISLAPGEGYGGSRQSVRYQWPVASCKRDHQISLEYKPPPQREFWVEVAVRFAPTFTTSERPCGGSAYKMIFFWLPDRGGRTGGRFDMINGANGATWRAAYPGMPAPPSGRDPADVDALNRLNGDSPTLNRRWDGKWHLYRFHIALSSCPTCADGAYEIWTDNPKDGSAMVRVESRRNLVVVNRTGAYADRVARITLGGNLNAASGAGLQVWWGRLRIWTSDPGW